MTRKKQRSQSRRNKKQTNPGVFISNLLGGASKADQKSAQSTEDSVKGDKNPVSDKNITRHKADESKNSLAELESVVLYKTVLELALVNIALGGGGQERGGVTGPGQYKTMAPVSSTTSAGSGGGSGLSKLMSPVQDLGKSLLGFLLGSPSDPPAGPDPVVMTPGRQRPPGHPAHPSVNATPTVIRRSKVEKTQTKPQETGTPPTVLPSSLVREEPEKRVENEKPPVPTKPRSVSRSRRRKNKKLQQKPGDHPDQDPGNRKVSLSLDPQDASQVSPQSEITSQVDKISQQSAIPSQEETISQQSPIPRQVEEISQQSEIPSHVQEISQQAAIPCQEEEISQQSEIPSQVEEISRQSEILNQEISSKTSPNDTNSSVLVAVEDSGVDEPGRERESCTSSDVNEKVSEVKLVHMKTHPEQDEIELGRKQVFDIKDESDKDNREVVEKSSQDLSSAASLCKTASVPAPPPLPPPGFLLDGLKSESEKTTGSKSGGTLKTKPSSRKDFLIDQLTGSEDPFTLFLKTQLNISTDPRERIRGSDQTPNTETLRRKKDRRKATEIAEKSDTKAEEETDRNHPADTEEKTGERTDSVEEGSAKSVQPRLVDPRVKQSCQNARDRPISIVDLEQISATNSEVPKDTSEDDPVIARDSSESLEKVQSEAKVDCGDSLEAEARKDEGDMKVESGLTEDTSQDTEKKMGAAHGTLLHQNLYSKQNLSKSDSGYSGHEDVDDVDDDFDPSPSNKLELTVDQALRKYDRIVEDKPPQALQLQPKKSRNRVLSEGSEFSSEYSDTDIDDKDEDGKSSRA